MAPRYRFGRLVERNTREKGEGREFDIVLKEQKRARWFH